MIFRIDPSNGSPVYDQIARQVKFAVASGAIKQGELIPSVRQLAKDLALNPNTIARAYRQLQDEEIVTPLRGTGLQIAEGARALCKASRREYVRERFRGAIAEARTSQLEDAEIRTVFESELKKRGRGSVPSHEVDARQLPQSQTSESTGAQS